MAKKKVPKVLFRYDNGMEHVIIHTGKDGYVIDDSLEGFPKLTVREVLENLADNGIIELDIEEIIPDADEDEPEKELEASMSENSEISSNTDVHEEIRCTHAFWSDAECDSGYKGCCKTCPDVEICVEKVEKLNSKNGDTSNCACWHILSKEDLDIPCLFEKKVKVNTCVLCKKEFEIDDSYINLISEIAERADNRGMESLTENEQVFIKEKLCLSCLENE